MPQMPFGIFDQTHSDAVRIFERCLRCRLASSTKRIKTPSASLNDAFRCRRHLRSVAMRIDFPSACRRNILFEMIIDPTRNAHTNLCQSLSSKCMTISYEATSIFLPHRPSGTGNHLTDLRIAECVLFVDE